MPYFATSQEWLRQSALLLEARPTTTRITTKYNIAKPKARKSTKSETADSTPTTTPKPPRGNLVIKTFDPVSGTTLKYRTTKAAEVGRLVLCLGRLGTRMTGLPGDSADVEIAARAPAPAGGEDVAMADDAAAQTPAAAPAAAAPAAAADSKAGGGGGKGKKKKGKK